MHIFYSIYIVFNWDTSKASHRITGTVGIGSGG